MRLLLTTPWTGFFEVGARGGVQDEYLTVTALVRRGHTVHLVAPHGADYALPGEAPGAFHLHTVPYPANRWRGPWRGQLGRLRDLARGMWAYGWCVRRLAGQIHPDLVLAHSFHTVPWAARVAKLEGCPAVGKFFGVLELNSGWNPRWLHWLRHCEHYLAFRAGCERLIILDDGTGGDEAALKLGVAPERLRFWPNGIDLTWGRGVTPGGGDLGRRRMLLSGAPGVLALTVCNLLPVKRVERVIEAVSKVAEVRLAVVGDGEQRAMLESLSRRLGVEGRVHFAGAHDHDQVRDWMLAADLYVAPHDLTNAGIPTCEAMLCGLPVVALDIGATRQLVADGDTGLVVPPSTGAAGLAAAIRRLALDPELRQRLGAAGQRRGEARFMSWDDRVALEVDLLESLARA